MENQERVWDSIAESWAKYRERPFGEVLDFLKRKEGRILDVGCGSGRNFLNNKKLQFYGIDFSEKMLELAEKKAKKEKMKVFLKKMSEEKIPFNDEFFDLALCISVLHCIPKKEKRIFLLNEIGRVLKRKGEVLLSVWSKNHKKIRGKDKEILLSWEIEGKIYNRYYYIYDLEELKEEVKSVGFKILEEKETDNIWLRLKNESV